MLEMWKKQWTNKIIQIYSIIFINLSLNLSLN